jgi:diaminopimelate epimerase
MRFEKWHALGNDYVIVERDQLPWELTRERVRRICAPHFGVGSDGVLLLARPGDSGGAAAEGGGEGGRAPPVAELRIFNPDGSEAELSGNGAREAALYLRAAGWTDADEFSIHTAAGEIRPRITSATSCALEMGRASTSSDDFPSGGADGKGALEAAGREWRFQHVSIGNPQCVIEVGDEVEELDLGAVGPEVEHHALFPNRTNVSFIWVDGSTVRARIFERGVGETLSSGTGACGAAVAATLGGARSPITVHLDGGELRVDVGAELDVVLTGPAEPVFAGELSPELLDGLANA